MPFQNGDYQESKLTYSYLVKFFVDMAFYTFKIPKIRNQFLIFGIRHKKKSRKRAVFTNIRYPANGFWFSPHKTRQDMKGRQDRI